LKATSSPFLSPTAKTDQRVYTGTGVRLCALGQLKRCNAAEAAMGASGRRTGVQCFVATGFGLHECDREVSSIPSALIALEHNSCREHGLMAQAVAKEYQGSRVRHVCSDTRRRAREGRLACDRCPQEGMGARAVFQSASVQRSWLAGCWKAQAGHMDQAQPAVHGGVVYGARCAAQTSPRCWYRVHHVFGL
jgi:hypothetical protein